MQNPPNCSGRAAGLPGSSPAPMLGGRPGAQQDGPGAPQGLQPNDLRVARGGPPLGAPTSARGQAERRSNDGEASERARGNFTHLCSPAGACSSPRDASDPALAPPGSGVNAFACRIVALLI